MSLNRKNYNNKKNNYKVLITKCGMPQDSVLGFLLFIMNVNKLWNTSSLLPFLMLQKYKLFTTVTEEF